MRRFLGLLFCLLRVSVSGAEEWGLSSHIEFQEQVEHRVNSRLKIYDPVGQATVKILFKEISAPLPGTKLNVEKFVVGAQGALTNDSIRKIDVIVNTARGDLSDWMKEDIRNSLAVMGLKANFEFKVYPEPQREKLEKLIGKDGVSEELVRQGDMIASAILKISNKMNQDLLQKMLGGLIGLCALAVVFGLYLSNRHNTILREMIRDEVLPFLKAMQGASSARVVLAGDRAGGGGEAKRVEAPQSHALANEFESSVIARLDAESIEALFSDCYWCAQDDYAAFLWNAMSREQQRHFLEKKFVSTQYVRYLQGRTPNNFSLHNDPNYVNPLRLTHVSQEDLARWVGEHPAVWHELSYLRRSTLPLKLKDRLLCIAAEPTPMPRHELEALTPSVKRKLPVTAAIGEISEDDELFILSDPKAVPVDFRASVPSLVWLLLISEETRLKLLSSLDAATLAKAWVGPRVVLEQLERLLPEQKRALLVSEVRKGVASREGEVMRYLVDEALRALLQKEAQAEAASEAQKKVA